VVGGSGDSGGAPPTLPQTTDKVDLLLVVDNSSSMADKQTVLGKSIHRLLDTLVNPPCVGLGVATPYQPASPNDACPTGEHRSFAPVRSVHLGIVSSSLGALGADQCQIDPNHENNDHGQLLIRSQSGEVSTYLDYGFLVFDPDAALSPPGEADYDQFVSNAVELVQGVGQTGCGYEMPLEAAYRFLADPSPYRQIVQTDPGNAFTPTIKDGIDTDLLAERERFLRPDSLVGVVMLTDENDCSVKAGGQSYAVLNAAGFFKSSTICSTNPLDACCYNCGLEAPPGCADPACDGSPRYDTNAGQDSVNLRCFHEMQRYGIDALYPIQRYINAFSAPRIVPTSDDLGGDGDSIVNPLFAHRSPSLFVMSGIVGVPWQSIAVDPSDPSQGFQSASELVERGTWSKILGEPSQFVDPAEPTMIESVDKRPGVNADYNGGDRTISTSAPTDLQYACIFPLAAPIPNGPNCGAGSAPDDPLCQGTTQLAAKAYPGIRELGVLRGLGLQGIVGSICEPSATDAPTQPIDPTNAGYFSAMNAMGARMASSLSPAQ
jgi:hypothetical protein